MVSQRTFGIASARFLQTGFVLSPTNGTKAWKMPTSLKHAVFNRQIFSTLMSLVILSERDCVVWCWTQVDTSGHCSRERYG